MLSKSKSVIIVILILYVIISIGQVYLDKYKPIAELPTETKYLENQYYQIVTEGYLYQFPGADPTYQGNYRMAIIRDKKNQQEFVVIFNDRAITTIERKNDK